jgi:NADP-dependent 3-hydroxy acid dehydrogenase YdfG
MRHPEQRETDLKGMKNIDVVHLDVLDPGSIQDAVRYTLKRHKRLDVLVNNAGYPLKGAFEATTQEQARKQSDTNVLGLMEVTREVLPVMREQRNGAIINVASVGGRVSFPMYMLCTTVPNGPWKDPPRRCNMS